jgi:hypothetical protein
LAEENEKKNSNLKQPFGLHSKRLYSLLKQRLGLVMTLIVILYTYETVLLSQVGKEDFFRNTYWYLKQYLKNIIIKIYSNNWWQNLFIFT